MPKEPPKETDKGRRVLFSTGPYRLKLGWLNKSKAPTARQKYVILEVGEDKPLHGTRVNMETICNYDESEPTCVEEAAMRRPKFLAMMNQFSWMVAKYNIELNEDSKFFLMFAALTEEKKALLKGMGEDADWKIVRYRDPSTKLMRTNFEIV